MRLAQRVRVARNRTGRLELVTGVGNVAAGDRVTLLEQAITRLDLAAYCLASGDRNPIHWSDDAARDAGLPDVIAHGMLTMGLACRAVIEWAGGDAELNDVKVRFARPLQVPSSVNGARVTITGTVRELSSSNVVLDLEVVDTDGAALLSAASATLRRKDS
jgi:acyl dehydratase